MTAQDYFTPPPVGDAPEPQEEYTLGEVIDAVDEAVSAMRTDLLHEMALIRARIARMEERNGTATTIINQAQAPTEGVDRDEQTKQILTKAVLDARAMQEKGWVPPPSNLTTIGGLLVTLMAFLEHELDITVESKLIHDVLDNFGPLFKEAS